MNPFDFKNSSTNPVTIAGGLGALAAADANV